MKVRRTVVTTILAPRMGTLRIVGARGLLGSLVVLASACNSHPEESQPALSMGETARVQVEATERAFALHGAQRVAAYWQGSYAYWQRFYEGPQAPFSWDPDQVEVLASGTLALSTGPVYDPQGQLISRFSSIWRQESPGVWRIVFDRGEPAAQE